MKQAGNSGLLNKSFSKMRSVSAAVAAATTAFARCRIDRTIAALVTAEILTLSSPLRRCDCPDSSAKKRAASSADNRALRVMSQGLACKGTNATTNQGARPSALILFTRCTTGNRNCQKRTYRYGG
jgi:hypothetical protein